MSYSEIVGGCCLDDTKGLCNPTPLICQVCSWPVSSDIAAQANVGSGGRCGSAGLALEMTLMTQNGAVLLPRGEEI
jgi:hypothetical protein